MVVACMKQVQDSEPDETAEDDHSNHPIVFRSTLGMANFYYLEVQSSSNNTVSGYIEP